MAAKIPKLITARGIPPRKLDELRWAKEIDDLVTRPMFRKIEIALKDAEAEYIHLRHAIRDIPNDPNLHGLAEESARKHMATIKKYHTERYHRSMRRFLGRKVAFMSDAALEPIMRQSIRDSVDLIVTIPQNMLAQLGQQMEYANRIAAFDQHQISRLLELTYKTSGYQTRRIARDQTNKTIGRLSQARQEQSGIKQYVWRTSMDGRVRETHAAVNGQVFDWSNPPPNTDGHPGHAIQCRCVAEPVIGRVKSGPPGTAKPPKPTPKSVPKPTPTPKPQTLPPFENQGRGAAEMRWHKMKYSWPVNSLARRAADKTKPLTEILDDASSGAYYRRRKDYSAINMRAEADNAQGGFTWMHEFGHYIDDPAHGGWMSDAKTLAPEYVKARGVDRKRWRNMDVYSDEKRRDAWLGISEEYNALVDDAKENLLNAAAKQAGMDRKIWRDYYDKHGWGRFRENPDMIGLTRAEYDRAFGRSFEQKIEAAFYWSFNNKDLTGALESLHMGRFIMHARSAEVNDLNLAGKISKMKVDKANGGSNPNGVDALAGLSDIADATTGGRENYRWRHPASYYKGQASNRDSENFANMTALNGMGDASWEMAKALFPNIARESEIILKRVAGE